MECYVLTCMDSCPGHRGSVVLAGALPLAHGLSSGSATSQPTLTCLLQGPPQPNLPPGRASPSPTCPLQPDPAWPPSQCSPLLSLRPQNPFPLASFTHVGVPGACESVPVPCPRCSIHTHLNSLILTAPGALWAGRAAALGSRLTRLVTFAPDSAHSSRPMHCSLGVAWGTCWLPPPFQEASMDWTHPSTYIGHPTPTASCPPHPRGRAQGKELSLTKAQAL